MYKRLLALLLMLFVVNGCASIDFFEADEEGNLTEKGFLYYPPKPYLLVEKKDDNINAKIISLPDLTRPHRVKQDNGWGTAELGFEIENGMIQSFNSKMDSKGPETLSALASLGTAKAALDTAEAAIITAELSKDSTMKMMGLAAEKEVRRIDYTVNPFKESYSLLKDAVIPPLESYETTFKGEILILKEVRDALKEGMSIDYKPYNPDSLLSSVEEKRKDAKKLTIQLRNVSSTLSFYAENKVKKPELILAAKSSKTALDEVAEKLVKFSLRSSSVTGLYEIQYINGHLNLHKVTYN